jgi:hypothetical protein
VRLQFVAAYVEPMAVRWPRRTGKARRVALALALAFVGGALAQTLFPSGSYCLPAINNGGACPFGFDAGRRYACAVWALVRPPLVVAVWAPASWSVVAAHIARMCCVCPPACIRMSNGVLRCIHVMRGLLLYGVAARFREACVWG